MEVIPDIMKKCCSQKKPIDYLKNNILERLKVSSIKSSFDNWIYVSNPQNANFYDLPLYGDQRLIAGRKIYHVNGDILYRLNNVSIVEIYTNIP